MEDGFTQIPNELLEEIAHSRTFCEKTRVFCVILRKTNGWQKEQDWIALSQFEEMTKMKKPNICRTLNKLIRAEVIIKMDNGDYRIRQRALSKSIDTKETVTKKNLTKEKYREFKNSFLKNKSMSPATYDDIYKAKNNII